MKRAIGVSFIGLMVIGIIIAIFFLVFPKKYEAYIAEYSYQYGLDKYLVASVINIESGYDSQSVSKVGALGLMQILPSTAFDIADRMNIKIVKDDLFDVKTNIKIGCFYLSYLIEMFDGNIDNALCAYNWGLSNVKKWLDLGNIDESGTITNIPIKETHNYLKKYRINRFVYKNIYKV